MTFKFSAVGTLVPSSHFFAATGDFLVALAKSAALNFFSSSFCLIRVCKDITNIPKTLTNVNTIY
ncbi:hypothetical protein P684_1864 [Acinetobacter baumannii UH8907]|nr:hypothetical protein P684_1864 [Acinetobacter baumannii UH8907]